MPRKAAGRCARAGPGARLSSGLLGVRRLSSGLVGASIAAAHCTGCGLKAPNSTGHQRRLPINLHSRTTRSPMHRRADRHAELPLAGLQPCRRAVGWPEAVLRRPGSVLFSAPQIAHFVMAITAASTIVRHTTLLGQLERPQLAVELRTGELRCAKLVWLPLPPL